MVTMKSTFEKMLRRKMEPPEEMNGALRDGRTGRISVREGIVASILGKALAGDLAAASFVRDICGEKTPQAAKKESAPPAPTLSVRIAEDEERV